MTPERLKKVEEIYHAVLEIPPPQQNEFLQNSCGEDVELRREVESLLSFETASAGIIDAPLEPLFREIFFNGETSSLISTEVNQYKILSLLGKGGMGEVYLALDKKLERKVAIKFLSDEFIQDGINLHRFFREAKSASALNHPNIITVYEIGEFKNKPFIATEFIDGLTLKEHSANRKLALNEMLDIAVQICSALSTAHKAGIIHRDIKPDNVMIREDGIVKVLDFGLAKVSLDSDKIDSEANTREKLSTLHGMIMGTPNYMSPEQARGKKIDARTDIWSFGVLFYQMLTRKLPFQGETTSDIIAAILKSEPPPLTQFVPDVPPELENITLKALRKSRRERYQTIDEFLAEIKRFQRDLEYGDKTQSLNLRISEGIKDERATDAQPTRITDGNSYLNSGNFSSFISQTLYKAKAAPALSAFILLSVGAFFLVVGLGAARLFSSANQTDSFQKMKLSKLTFDAMVSDVTAVSPDGKYIVYSLREEGKESLMVRQIAASSTLQIIPPADVSYAGVTFTPDSNFIYYSVIENGVGNLYEIPALGGNPRKILENVDKRVTFSPDGKMMAFARADNLLMLADTKGGSQRVLATAPEKEMWTRTAFSPDGQSIMSAVDLPAGTYLAEIQIDGMIKPFSSTRWTQINGLAWLSDKSGIVLSGRDPETKYSQIWFLSYPDGEPRRITNDFSTYGTLSLTADNKSLVVRKEERLYNIWVSPDGKQESLKKITLEEGRDDGIAGIARAPDGKIVYTVRLVDNFDIWLVNADGSGNRQLTFDEGTNFQPAISPDGKYIVFTSNRNGKLNLWRMNIDGSSPVSLTDNTDKFDQASFTPDGKWLIYRRTDKNNLSTVWKMNPEDKNAIQLTDLESRRPTVSPDGKFVACEYGEASGKPPKLAVIPIEGGKPVKILDLPPVLKSKVFRWAADGKSLIYVEKRDRIDNLWSQPLDGSPPKQLTFFESGQIERFDVAPDGKGFAFSRGTYSSDVVMFEDFR